MDKHWKLLGFMAALPLAAFMATTAAQAADDVYPHKPIRMVVGFPAGGSADASARPVANFMSKALGTTIVVENRGGAAGSVAAQIVAQAAPDGYTINWTSPGAITINRILEKNLPYNAETAFTPVGRSVTFCNALIVRQDSPLTTVPQFIAYAREHPGKLQYGTQGIGSAGHLSATMLQNMTGIKITIIPYKGGTEILAAVVNGEAASAFLSSTAASTLRSRVRVLAVTSVTRDPVMPDVQTMSEAGVRNYDATFWYGLLVPAGTPQPIVMRLNKELRAAVTDPEVARLGRAQGFNAAPDTPAEFADLIKSEYVRWRKVLGETG